MAYAEELSGDQDELRVYYKSTPSDTWTLLAEYTNGISAWTKDSIALPSPSANYQIAFEATDGYGYGVLLDDITVKGTPIMRTVTTNVNNAQWGSVTGGGAHAMGTEVTLTAVPAEGCEFVCWNNYDPSLTVSFTVFADTTVSATFTPIGQAMHRLTVQAQDETMGTVVAVEYIRKIPTLQYRLQLMKTITSCNGVMALQTILELCKLYRTR